MIKYKYLILIGFILAAPFVFAEEHARTTEISEPKVEAIEPIQSEPETSKLESSYDQAAKAIQQQLADSITELNLLREQVANEKIPLSQKLNDLENELIKIRREYQETSRVLDNRTLDLSNLRSEIKSRKQEATYLSNLLSEYTRNFESQLHIAELQLYKNALEQAKLAPENSNLSEQEIYKAQAGLLSVSLDRLQEALGGTRFDGTASDSSGSIHHGTFVVIGPAALFQSDDGKNIGTAEQRLGSLEPTIIEFANPADIDAASNVIFGSPGYFPLDPTLGNAHKMEETEQTVLDEVNKGGVVMYPIFALAGAALLVAVLKWLSMAFLRTPSQRKIRNLLNAVSDHDFKEMNTKVKKIKGPIGKMLTVGVEHIQEPKELIEEVMYEKVMATRLKLERFLPFIAISAASAPLLGLLGTVTGIINTFKLITVFGSGDVKSLSGGISEALITTKYGLIVAIPSLLIHAFLSRKARGFINQMEKTAVALVNQVTKTPFPQQKTLTESAVLTHDQLQSLIENIKDQVHSSGSPEATLNLLDTEPEIKYSNDSAGGLMNTQVISVGNTATVSDAINKIRTAEISDDIDAVFIVDEQGKYVGHVLVRHLLMRPEDDRVESLTDSNRLFVRVDSHKNEVQDMFRQHDLINVPVVDHDDLLVGRIARNGNGDH